MRFIYSIVYAAHQNISLILRRSLFRCEQTGLNTHDNTQAAVDLPTYGRARKQHGVDLNSHVQGATIKWTHRMKTVNTLLNAMEIINIMNAGYNKFIMTSDDARICTTLIQDLMHKTS